MKDGLRNIARILGVLAMLTFFAAPLKADPIVLVTSGGASATNINSTEIFILGITDDTGMLTAVLRNNTNSTFVAFHFFQEAGIQSMPWQGNAIPLFSEVFANNFSIDFFQGHQGTGIPPNTTFTVTLTGFAPGTTILANATVPEPATLLLLGTGLAGVALKVRRKLRRGL